jgi:prolyl oligopeptidase
MKPQYPSSSVLPVQQEMHGVVLQDDFRWLEDGQSSETQAWVAAQNQFCRQSLASIAGREVLSAELQAGFDVAQMSTPQRYGQRLFYTRREAGQNHAVWYYRDGGLDNPEVLALDPNGLSPDGTTALDYAVPSPQGRYLAYGISPSGSEIGVLKIRDLSTGKDLALEIAWVRYASPTWLADERGFYYARYPEPGSVAAGDEQYYRKIFFHDLSNDNWQADPLVFASEDKTHWPSPYAASDQQTLFIHVSYGAGGEQNDLYWLPLVAYATASATAIAVGLGVSVTGNAIGQRLFIKTTYQASRGQMLQATLSAPTVEHWRPLVPEQAGVLSYFTLAKQHLLLWYTTAAVSSVLVYDHQGQLERELVLPGVGTLVGLGTTLDAGEIFYAFQSFTVPQSVYQHDLGTQDTALVFQAETGLALDEFETKQVFYPSKDGTQIPMFIVARRGLLLDQSHPTLLYGYGGFNVSMYPSFVGTIFPWISRGGVYAVANIRGGSEFGEDWHQAGMLERKQNVFDDFIAAGEYLVSEKYTTPARLGCYGGSNGGLLTGAMLVQRPDLFGAVVIGVPLLDMLRYQQFLIARLWIPEYGDPEDAAAFAWLRAYSPYHNVKAGTEYPATLILTGASDSRVDPLHARKMAALLQRDSGGSAPILLRVEAQAGHGQGKPVGKQIAELTDRWSFLAEHLGLDFAAEVADATPAEPIP